MVKEVMNETMELVCERGDDGDGKRMSGRW